jgi:hypothetical protein
MHFVQEQLIDHVIHSSERSVTAAIPEHEHAVTGASGHAELLLPPGATVSVQCVPSGADASDALVQHALTARHTFVVASQPEQRVALTLPRPASLTVVVRELGTEAGVCNAEVRCLVIEDELGQSVDGAARDVQSRLHATDQDGRTAPFAGRAGMLVRAELASLPPELLPMAYLDRLLDQQHVMRLTGVHELEWVVPRKPRIRVCSHDAASGEQVVGVRYRVMTRRHTPAALQPQVSFGGALSIRRARPQVRHGYLIHVPIAMTWQRSCNSSGRGCQKQYGRSLPHLSVSPGASERAGLATPISRRRKACPGGRRHANPSAGRACALQHAYPLPCAPRRRRRSPGPPARCSQLQQ